MERERNTFKTLIKLNFFFCIMKVFLLLSIYFTYDENIFNGISMKAERNSIEYYDARTV
jgi:hypothetical protein